MYIIGESEQKVMQEVIKIRAKLSYSSHKQSETKQFNFNKNHHARYKCHFIIDRQLQAKLIRMFNDAPNT
ncbi:CLUMA_CG021182, isoform A [Clunio marinus]|uniref:CLUMA_CG021182, isoform A n=1 Tax=Clunio marinus TaxID=568069 RepID=A0A1J1J6J3_9DIPT|nr:CLUMA_CG021182, isoform A [Clunio marinus]